MRSSELRGQRIVNVTGEPFIVDGTVDLDELTITDPPGDGLILASRATGRIGYLGLTTRQQDGIKVQNAGTPARSFVIESGILRAHDSAQGAHQDGIQVMGGSDLTFRRLSILGFDTQGIFVNRGGSGATTPTRIRIEDCYVGPTGATAVNINNAIDVVVTRCHIWETERFGRALIGLPVGDNTIHDSDDPFPPGVPGGDPPPPPTGDCEEMLALTKGQLNEVMQRLVERDQVIANLRGNLGAVHQMALEIAARTEGMA
jgi:hypothetical protein